MPRRRFVSPSSGQLRLARQLGELGLAAPAVMAERLSRLAAAGPRPSARDRREFSAMVLEKPAAFGQAWWAMGLEAAQAWQRMATSIAMAPWTLATLTPQRAARQISHAWLGIAGKGLGPVHRTAAANARRLARQRRR